MEDWLKSKGKYEIFVKSVSGMLEAVQSLGLQWCKALPYTMGNFGGWVSENYLAFARLLPWFYSSVNYIESVQKPYEDPLGPRSKWTVTQNKRWLISRNLPAFGKAKDLRAAVDKYMNQEGGPPPVCPGASGTIQDIVKVVWSMWSMVCNLMVKEVTPEQVAEVQHQIKCFLSFYDALDKRIPAKKNKKQKNVPTWLQSYNFVCLLNLPDVMSNYGPLPNLWEGGGQGEKVLSRLKPLHNGYRAGWQKHLLSNALDAMALD